METQEQVENTQPVKRGRGRPRKYPKDPNEPPKDPNAPPKKRGPKPKPPELKKPKVIYQRLPKELHKPRSGRPIGSKSSYKQNTHRNKKKKPKEIKEPQKRGRKPIYPGRVYYQPPEYFRNYYHKVIKPKKLENKLANMKSIDNIELLTSVLSET